MTQPLEPAYGPFQVGGASFPLRTDITFLQAADPAVFYMLDYYTYCIQAYVETALKQAANLSGAPIVAAVAQRYPAIPTPTQMVENQLMFPLLCIGRKKTKTRWKTAAWNDYRGSFDLLYVLPPLTAGQSESLIPMLHAISETLVEKTDQSNDANYTPPGGTAGQTPWGQGFAGVEEIGFGDGIAQEGDAVEYTYLEHEGNLYFPCLLMHGFILERKMYVQTGPGKFAGGDVNLDLVAPDGTKISNFIQASTQQPPTVTAVSPATGTIAGGTGVTITGTLFLQAPTVLFGNRPATSVVWNSATSITCVSPAVAGPGIVGVIVANTDGQSGYLANSYTYF